MSSREREPFEQRHKEGKHGMFSENSTWSNLATSMGTKEATEDEVKRADSISKRSEIPGCIGTDVLPQVLWIQ